MKYYADLVEYWHNNGRAHWSCHGAESDYERYKPFRFPGVVHGVLDFGNEGEAGKQSASLGARHNDSF